MKPHIGMIRSTVPMILPRILKFFEQNLLLYAYVYTLFQIYNSVRLFKYFLKPWADSIKTASNSR